MIAIFTAPSSTALIASIGEYSAPWFQELLPLVYISVGFIVAGLLISALIGLFPQAFNFLFRRKDKFED